MMADAGSMEGLLSGAGVTLAAAVIMIVALSLFQSLEPADAYIALRSAAAGISGDIATVAASWTGTCGLLEYLNDTFERSGTRGAPLSRENGSKTAALLETARLSMASRPLAVEPDLPLKVEKLFLHAYDNASERVVIEPYVFVYQ